jgi:outer membrane protein OmpA-like peptidoglycan-associated protein
MKLRRLLCVLVLISGIPLFGILSGCTTTNPYTGEQQISKTTIGTGVGVAGGALIGALAGGQKGALIGAALGGATGAVAGNLMDRQDAELRQALVGTGVGISKQGNFTQLMMASDVTFRTNSSDINAGFYPPLNSVAQVLRKYSNTNIIISGYTDNTGGDAYNQQLSEQRAASVGSYLVSHGVSPARIFTQGFGKRNPVASNSTAEGRAKNRRVEISIRPKG